MIELWAPQHIKNTFLQLSGSKSISNRWLILNAVLELGLVIENLSDAEDTVLLKNALQQIKGSKKSKIDIQHAGSDMRFLTALLACREGEWTLTGSDRMKQRPIGELVTALKSLGANITYLEKEGFPPLLIRGQKLAGGNIEIDSGVSSQFVSALLLIAPSLEKGLTLTLKGRTVSMPYIDMTVSLLRSVGVLVEQKENLIQVSCQSNLDRVIPQGIVDMKPIPPSSSQGSSGLLLPSSIYVESDWSSASYWYAICALAGNAEIELGSLYKKSLQADSVLPLLYKDLGVKTTFKENSIVLSSIKPVIKDFSHDFTNCPDIAQTLAVTCFGLGIKARLYGLSTLKVKETDRILALKTELEKCGAKIEITKESIDITPSGNETRIREPEIINTYNDHRMAMSFAPLALLYKSIKIEDPSVVRKSYGSFWEDLKSVGFNVNLQP